MDTRSNGDVAAGLSGDCYGDRHPEDVPHDAGAGLRHDLDSGFGFYCALPALRHPFQPLGTPESAQGTGRGSHGQWRELVPNGAPCCRATDHAGIARRLDLYLLDHLQGIIDRIAVVLPWFTSG